MIQAGMDFRRSQPSNIGCTVLKQIKPRQAAARHCWGCCRAATCEPPSFTLLDTPE